jgi:DNA-binding MarR family transcriptional regulator
VEDIAQSKEGQTGQQAQLITLTPAGRQAHSRLVAAQRAELNHLLQGWSPDQESELATLLTQMAEQLLTDESGDHELITARAGSAS